jgi:hypothetical protein
MASRPRMVDVRKDQRFDIGKLECAQVRAPMQDGG